MKRRIWFWVSALIASLMIGLGSAALAVRLSGFSVGTAIGPWVTNSATGSTEADLYTRATTAVYGLLALSRKETAYYNAVTDSAGALLSGDCTYRLAGRDLPARWWSITAYGSDSYLIANPTNRYSITQTGVEREADGSYVMVVSAKPQPRNWLPVKAGERFELTARAYNPRADFEVAAAAALPAIVKEGC
jgi:hypothetical protein